jgi:signal transduction histidine kinase
MGAEIALGLLAGGTSFALVALALVAAESDVVVVLLGVIASAAVVAMARFWGVAYGVPAAMAALLAYDWFQFPPTHPHEFPDSADLVNLLVYLGVAALVGELAAYSGRRADLSEVARGALVREQAALRRVATLVARAVPPDEVFAAVAKEVGTLLQVDGARVARYDGDDVDQLAGWSAPGYDPPPLGRVKLERTSLAGKVLHTGRPARIDDYEAVDRALAVPVPRGGARSGVAAPIVVDGRLWGVIAAWLMRPDPLPDMAEARLADFTELVATAISNTTGREQLGRLADEQAALRRVATLVARAVPPPEVFAAVAREVGQLLSVDVTHMARYELDGTATGVASWGTGPEMPVGTRVQLLDGESATALVLRTGRPARVDSYDDARGPAAQLGRDMGLRSSVAAPIVVDGQLWGVMIASSTGDEPLPADTESRIAAFTELVATAISNTEARAEVGWLAEEQASLRRVATLVARESSPAEVFAAVAQEVGRLLRVDDTTMFRYEDEATATVVANWSTREAVFPIGNRQTLEGESVTARVLRTGRSARMDDYSQASGSLGTHVRELGYRSAVGSPIVVERRLWGAMVATSRQAEPLPDGTEARISEFTELVATAISNIEARSDLAASRARIAAAADDERRRVVRDLHDGAQQRLVHTVVTLKLARRALEHEAEAAPRLVTEALHQAQGATVELRELAHGIMPAVLTRGGLRAGVDALASRMPVPVENDVSVGRLPATIEATAYFVVAEALTNVAKHAHAGHAAVTAQVEDDTLAVQVRDDGVGGAQPDGTGLLGLADRLAVLDGRLRVDSPADGGTVVAASIPLAGR